jgi:hypothetical protein
VGQVQQRVLNVTGLALLVALVAFAQKFYPDDPVPREPQPIPVTKAKGRKLSEYYDFFWHTFATPGEKQPKKGKPIPAQSVNTLGEVLDGAWYMNRHGRSRMSIEELRRGPGDANAPSKDGPWKVVSAKTEGVTPGFNIVDSRGETYVVKVDPADYPEMATAADVIGAKIFYALGYHVPENYVVTFERKQLVIAPEALLTDSLGNKRNMNDRDIDEILFNVPRVGNLQYRAVASRFLKGKWLGPFRFHGVRSDDPNDVIPHEHRRELRGLFVFSAWLGHNDVKSLNDVDFLVDDGSIPHIRHHLIDFGAAFGSDSFTAKSPRAGNQYLFQFRPSIAQVLTLGLYVPRWARAHYPDLPEVGHFESDMFEPERWKPNYPNPAFENRLPDDTFWAARQVMSFRDEEIRAMVETGEYTDPKSVDWIAKCLIARRDKIGNAYLTVVLPLDRFRVEAGRLEFDDLAAKYGLRAPSKYQVQWSRFDNSSARKDPLPGRTTSTIPGELGTARPGEYFAADIRSDDPKKTVTVYLRSRDGRAEIAGIDRAW